MEQAALKHLTQLEEFPPKKAWQQIGEEWARHELRNTLQEQETHPSKELWARIESKSRRTLLSKYLFVGIVLVVLTASFWIVRNGRESNAIVQAGTRESGLSSQETKLPPSTETTPIEKPTDIQRSINNNHTVSKSVRTEKMNEGDKTDVSDYLLVARTTGQPMRIPLRWEGLSCCLSGENITPECDRQRDQWHQELLSSELGFHADPIIGLLALIEPTK